MRSIVDVPTAPVKALFYGRVETLGVAKKSWSVHDSYENSATALEVKIEEAFDLRMLVWEEGVELACLVLLLTILNFWMN